MTPAPESRGLSGPATAAVVGVAAIIPLLGVYRVAVYTPGSAPAILAAIATICLLPIQSWLVLTAAHGRSTRRHRLALAIVALAVMVLVPVIGTDWFNAVYPVCALVLLLVPRPWSIAIFAALLVTPPVVFTMTGQGAWGLYFGLGVFMFSMAVAVPVWLTSAARQLEEARAALVAESIIRERLRIDATLRATVGAALEGIAGRAERAGTRVTVDPAGAAREVRTVMRDARATMAEVRRLARDYQPVSLRAELGAAVALLAAAGIDVTVHWPPGPCADVMDATQRAQLQAELAGLLADEKLHACQFIVSFVDGRTEVRLRPDRPAMLAPSSP